MELRSDLACPCSSGNTIDACCGRWHRGESAPSAEALMRSRYSAFVLRNDRYLLATWHSKTRPKSVPFDANQKWLGLRVIEAMELSASAAEVEFIARYKIGGGSAARLHERSRFVKEADQWFYLNGDIVDSTSAERLFR